MKKTIIYTAIFIGLLMLATAINLQEIMNFETTNYNQIEGYNCTTRECYSKITNGEFTRFFTMIHENGTVEKIILIEEYPEQPTERTTTTTTTQRK